MQKIPGTAVFRPDFNSIPIELKKSNRWVLAKNKEPYMSESVNSHANVSDPTTWSSFAITQAAYEEGGYDGVGFVFNGDGIVGVDLDDCVFNGQPTDAAIQILGEIGCSYIEISQSGQGLHAYGFYAGPALKGKRGVFKGIKTEIYSSVRFFVVTGNVWQQGILQSLKGLKAVYDQIDRRHYSSMPEETKVIASVSSVSSVQIPRQLIPKREGQRHDCIFELARYLKAVMPAATEAELKYLLEMWWKDAEPIVRTKDFNESLIDLYLAWGKVKFPKGEFFSKILSSLPDKPAENPGDILGMPGRRLYLLCQLLDVHQRDNFGNDEFILSCRKAGEALNIDHRQANKILQIFVAKGLLDITQKSTEYKANRYRLRKPECAAPKAFSFSPNPARKTGA